MALDSLGIVGTTVGEKYVVEHAVGEGSFAVVYRALHIVWQRPVAIKVFRVLAHLQPDARRRLLSDFIEEGALLSELSGRSATIVQARDVGMLYTPDGDELPYIVLEWLEGRTLEDVLLRERQSGSAAWSLEKATSLLEPVALALDMAHGRGVAHRDIKPANLFLCGEVGSADLRVKVLDFGVAKVVGGAARRDFTKTAGVVSSFTPAYGAPEQFTRSLGSTGPWTDVYALGLVLVELLSGRPVAEGDDVIQLGMAAVDATRRPTPDAFGITLAPAIEHVFATALAVKPDARYESAGSFWRSLREAERASIGPAADGPEPRPSSLDPHALPAATLAGPTSALSVDSAREVRAPAGRARGAPVVLASALVGAASGIGLYLAMPTLRFHLLHWVALAAASQLLPWSGAKRPRVMSTSPEEVVDVVHGSALDPPAPGGASPDPEPAARRPDRTTSRARHCLPEMALVEPTSAEPGADAGSAPQGTPEARSRMPFCLDRREVTVGAYRACAVAGACAPAPFEVAWRGITRDERRMFSPFCNGDDPARYEHPANCISYSMAVVYCAFVHKRLPSEREWELAAVGTDGRRFPWGDQPPDAARTNGCGHECVAWGQQNGLSLSPSVRGDDAYVGTAPVGAFPAGRSPFGVFDMAGNVWEWVTSDDGPPSTTEDRPVEIRSANQEGTHVLRGGGFFGPGPTPTSSSLVAGQPPRPLPRILEESETRNQAYGFRCAGPPL